MFTLFLLPQNTNETRYRKTVSAFVLSGELSVLRYFQCPKEEQQFEPFPRGVGLTPLLMEQLPVSISPLHC